MALVLGMKIGDHVYVGGKKITLVQVKSPERFVLKLHETWDKLVEIDSVSRMEIVPEVFVFASKAELSNWAKVNFEAPRSINIVRGKLVGGKSGTSKRDGAGSD